MAEIFRKHYSYGETIPILDTHVGMSVDIYEVTDKSVLGRPYIKAVFIAKGGPMKSLPLIVEPLDNDSKVVHISDIPVPIPSVGSVDLSLIFDVANYRWTPSPEAPSESGLVTFDLRLRAAFSLLSKSYTLLLDQRPCAITLNPQLSQMQIPVGIGAGLNAGPQTGKPTSAQPTGQMEYGNVPYGRSEQRWTVPVSDGSEASSKIVTGQLEVEERLRELSARLFAHS